MELENGDNLWSDIRIVQLGQLQLSLGGWSFPNFLEAFPICTMKNGVQSYNKKLLYGGTPDFIGIPMGWNKIKGYDNVLEVVVAIRRGDVFEPDEKLASIGRNT